MPWLGLTTPPVWKAIFARARRGGVPAVLVVFGVGAASAGLAFPEGDAASKVRVYVGTVVHLELGDPTYVVSGGAGKVEVDVPFRVSANTDLLQFQCFASDLYKAGDPDSPHKMLHGAGVLLAIPGARPLAGGSSFLSFLEGVEEIKNGLLLYGTETRMWGSSHSHTFTRDAVATFEWIHPTPYLPEGEYVGVVKMTVAKGSF
ncbi:MAG: hypothetical protein Kow0092_21700 [Deferrisomatales bacterium]